MSTKKTLETLTKLKACQEAKDWVKDNKIKSLWEAIEKCNRSDWQEWLLYKTVPHADEYPLRNYGIRCIYETPLHDGRKVFDLLTDDRSINAVIVSEYFANGTATDEDLSAASAAAWSAASAASAAAWAAASAAAESAVESAASAARSAAWAAQSKIFVEAFSQYKSEINKFK
jgi:hypothetical protein